MSSYYWPNVTSGDDKPFADKLNAIQKVVFSKTLKRASWGLFPEKNGYHGFQLLSARSFDRGAVLLAYAGGNGAAVKR